MTGPAEVPATPPRVAHLHARPGWGAEEARLLDQMRQMQAQGAVLVLVAAVSGELSARARRVGLRVVPFETGFWARRQLAMDLQEFSLTRLAAHDPQARALAKWLKRRLGIPLADATAAAGEIGGPR